MCSKFADSNFTELCLYVSLQYGERGGIKKFTVFLHHFISIFLNTCNGKTRETGDIHQNHFILQCSILFAVVFSLVMDETHGDSIKHFATFIFIS